MALGGLEGELGQRVQGQEDAEGGEYGIELSVPEVARLYVEVARPRVAYLEGLHVDRASPVYAPDGQRQRRARLSEVRREQQCLGAEGAKVVARGHMAAEAREPAVDEELQDRPVVLGQEVQPVGRILGNREFRPKPEGR